MSVGLLTRIIITGLASVSSAVASAAEPPPISHNPFSRPPSAAINDARSPNSRVTIAPDTMDLRATLVASNDRLANVAGKILKPGDELQGFKLVHVYEDRAIFEQQGRQFVIYVKPRVEEQSLGENDD